MRLIDADELKKQAYESGDWDKPLVVDVADIDDAPTIDQWHYPDNGEYITEPNLCIRYIDRSGDEFIGYTEWYYPSEDEIGYGSAVISVICNGVPVDDNDIKMWCELPYPPKEEATIKCCENCGHYKNNVCERTKTHPNKPKEWTCLDWKEEA